MKFNDELREFVSSGDDGESLYLLILALMIVSRFWTIVLTSSDVWQEIFWYTRGGGSDSTVWEHTIQRVHAPCHSSIFITMDRVVWLASLEERINKMWTHQIYLTCGVLCLADWVYPILWIAFGWSIYLDLKCAGSYPVIWVGPI